ncbi:MAG TPA: lactate racemase domain-containing protein [Planctomycetota bacterium]|nr:lactate racemase domain-containing protein [Planctomycetota bacterium]
MQSIDPEGIVQITEKGDGPLFLPNGERFVYASVPVGTRVLYPRPPLPGYAKNELRAQVERAVDNPIDTDPLRAHLKPGMKVTIAIDDISLSLPKQQLPDCRQTVLEVLLDRLGQAGVTDVHLVIAVCLHRHMHDWEVKEMVGSKIFDAHWNKKTLYNYDAEDKDDNIVLGHTDHGEIVEIQRRAATSDLLIYVNLNLIALNGGHKSVGVGLATYRCVRSNHNCDHQINSRSFNDPPRSKMHRAMDRIGKYVKKHVKIFHIETTVNNDTFPNAFPTYLGYMQKQEAKWNILDRVGARLNKHFLDCTPLSLNRSIFFAIKSPYKVTGVHAGETEPVHKKTLENVYKQQLVEIKGQSDIVVMPIPYVMPYSVHSIMNPILVYAMGLGYMFNFYRNQPIVKKGGTIIFIHPLENKFHEIHHPSYVELFENLKITRDPYEVDRRWSDQFANDERYIKAYRYNNAYHGFHAISMWNWGCHGMQHVGQIISVNPTSRDAARQLGWEIAPTVEEAIAMGRSKHGPSASVSVVHSPPIAMWDVK